MTAFQTIADALAKEFAAIDAQQTERNLVWAKERVVALFEYKASADYNERSKKGAWGGQYQKMFDICGGKTWFQVLQYGFSAHAQEFVKKNTEANAKKRDAKIAQKLVALGITQVTKAEMKYNDGGFDGLFTVETEQGPKLIVINTIYAGGFNIQCFHQRTLVKVRN